MLTVGLSYCQAPLGVADYLPSLLVGALALTDPQRRYTKISVPLLKIARKAGWNCL
jgi:hypothetical protein